MANSTTFTLTGTAYWAQLFPENVDWGYEDEHKDTGGVYTVKLVLDEEAKDKLRESNSQAYDYPKRIKDTEGNEIEVYQFKRFHEKRDRAGKILEFASGQPKVVHADDTPWDVEDDGFIGNGSELEVTLTVYKAGRVYGTRLEKVKVLDYVAPPVKL